MCWFNIFITMYFQGKASPNEKQNTMPKAVSWFRVFCDLLVLLVLLVLSQLVLQLIPPFHAGFSCTDTSISLPFRPSTVTSLVLGLTTVLSPLLVILGTELVRITLLSCKRSKNLAHKRLDYTLHLCCWGARRLPDFIVHAYRHLTVYYLGLTVTNGLTNLVKLVVGRLRPNFLAVCRPRVNPFLEVCKAGVVEYVVPGVDFECGNADLKEVDASRKSFPSGHSSLMFFSMVS
jgi:phosphatidate phosphatase